jgi:hypothetical protein
MSREQECQSKRGSLAEAKQEGVAHGGGAKAGGKGARIVGGKEAKVRGAAEEGSDLVPAVVLASEVSSGGWF